MSSNAAETPHPPAARPVVPTPAGPCRCDVLLLFVNEKEKAAIVGTFRAPDGAEPPPRTIEGIACLDLGIVGERRVLAMGTNMGSVTPGGTATLVLDAIKKLDPGWIIAVGVAFGMDPVKTPIGTILVSDRVCCYEPARLGTQGPIQRGDSVSVQPRLRQHLQTVATPPYWTGAPVRFGLILSGEKLIDDPQFKERLRTAYPEAIGGEMEAAGIYSAAMLEQHAWIVVKAVCDFADGNKGKNKSSRQAKAAANAARFVHHCLTAYDAPPVPDLESGPTRRFRADPEPEPEPAAESIRADALASIAASLDLAPPLREALARRLTGDPAARAVLLAERLCPPEADGFQMALSALRAALPEALKSVRQGQGDLKWLRQRAHDILGWMVVTTVLDGYDAEAAPAVRRWFDGHAFHVPIGRNVCLEVLSARWLRQAARFGVEPTARFRTGEDDITPEHPGEIGFDDPFRLDHGRVVNEVWRLIYQKIEGRPAPLRIDTETREILSRRHAIQLQELRRRLRLVLDPADLNRPIDMGSALEAIRRDIPWLHLIVTGVGEREDIFIVPAAALAGDIKECLARIDALDGPPG